MIKSLITDPASKIQASVDNASNTEKNGVVVATRPLKTLTYKSNFFLNATYGADMNINASATGGATELVHDGGDGVGWTGLNTTGVGFNFAGAVNVQTGAASVNFAGTNNNKMTMTDATTTTGFTALTFGIWLTTWSVGNTVRMRVKDVGGNTLGTAMLETYVNPLLLGQWQQISIPWGVGGFGMLTTDAVSFIEWRVRTGGAAVPAFDFDDMSFTTAGGGAVGSQVFTITPDTSTWLHVDSLKLFMADAMTGLLADATMPNLAYNQLLASAALSVGIQVHIWRNDTPELITTINQLADILQIPSSKIEDYGSNGTNAWMSLNLDIIEPWVLKSEDNEYMTVTLNDDLSVFLQFRVAAGCRVETR